MMLSLVDFIETNIKWFYFLHLPWWTLYINSIIGSYIHAETSGKDIIVFSSLQSKLMQEDFLCLDQQHILQLSKEKNHSLKHLHLNLMLNLPNMLNKHPFRIQIYVFRSPTGYFSTFNRFLLYKLKLKYCYGFLTV